MQPYIRAYCLIGAKYFALCTYVDAYRKTLSDVFDRGN